MQAILRLLAVILLGGVSHGATRPNVLFIAVDDLRPELACYGASHVISPNIDRLAARGTLFTRAYCQQAICNPSRASVLTGLRPDSTGVSGNSQHFRTKAPDVFTLPQHFKEHGYHTQAFGKIYHGSFEKAYVGTKLDDNRSWSVPDWKGSPRYYYTPLGIEIARQVYAKESGKEGAALDEWTEAFVRGLSIEAPDVPDSTLYDGELTDRVIQRLRTLKSGGNADSKPFFIAAGYMKPHVPFIAPKKYWDLYDPEKIALATNPAEPKDAPTVAFHDWRDVRYYSDIPKEGPVSPELARRLRHGYYACVSFIDAQIGRLLDELDRLELRDNTVVVFWGDHGHYLGEHGMWSKSTNFEYATRVPLIVSAPGTAPGKTRALVELVDIYPTLCELAGLPLPAHLEGISMAAVMKDPDRPWKAAAFSQYPRRRPGPTAGLIGYSIRTDRYRHTVWHPLDEPNDIKAVELYDHRDDPEENVNIAGRAENSTLVRQLTEQLRRGWRAARPAM